MNRFRFPAALLALGLASCGGGNPGIPSSPLPAPPQVLTVSPASINVSASASDLTAPSVYIDAGVTNVFQGLASVSVSSTYKGIANVQVDAGGPITVVSVNFKNPALLAPGTYSDSITLSACVDGSCGTAVQGSPQTIAVQYVVTPATLTATPTIAALSPPSAVAGDVGFTLTVQGQNFSPQATVQWNGMARPTTFLSTTGVTAQISAADIAAASQSTVTVTNQASGGGTSGGVGFAVALDALTLGTISPASVVVGGPAFTLTALGSGFLSSSVLQWNGTALPTTVISPTELTAQVPSADIVAAGAVAVTVSNTTGGAAATPPSSLLIAPASADAVTYRMNAAQTGSLTVSDFALPAGKLWQASLAGAPSYALVAGGRVFVATNTPNGMQVLALDAASGAVSWGPRFTGNSTNLAYDGTSLYVLVDDGSGTGQLLSLAAATGQVPWSVSLQDDYANSTFLSPPVAGNGMVYVAASDIPNGSVLYAVSQSDGSVAWNSPIVDPGIYSPALGADGLYVGSGCTILDLRPATGEQIWIGPQGGCIASPAPSVSGGVVFGFGYFTGTPFPGPSAQLDAQSGVLLNSYLASSLPAMNSQSLCYLQAGALNCPLLGGGPPPWQFAGDGQLTTAPVLVNSYAFVGSAAGNLYAVNLLTGKADWQAQVGAPIAVDVPGGPTPMMSAITAGDGLLLVPAGNSLIAYSLTGATTP